MSIGSSGSRYLSAADMNVVELVYKRLCAERMISGNSQAKTDLMRELVDLFQSGLQDADALYGAYEYPIGPTSESLLPIPASKTQTIRHRPK